MHYRALGLIVDSELPLPLPTARAGHGNGEGVAVRRAGADEGTPDHDPRAELVASLEHAGGGYEIRRGGAVYTASFASHGWLRIDVAGSRLDVSRETPALAHLAANLGLATYLVARGHCVLHASAFRWQGGLHAIVGGSRSGKSTLAALLATAGATVASDDTVRVVFSDPIRCAGSSMALRLRPSAAPVADELEAGKRHVSVDGRHVVGDTSRDEGEGRLASMWFVCAHAEVGEPSLVALSRASALQRLVEGLRIRGLRDRALMEQQLAHLALLARSIPAFEARVPWGPPFRRQWGEALLLALGRVHP